MMSRRSQFINHSLGIVLDGNETVAIFVENHVILAKTVHTSTLARALGAHVAEIAGGREENPVYILFGH